MKTIDHFHPPQQLIETFCRESNFIEGERDGDIGKLYPGDIGLCRTVIGYAGGNKALTEHTLRDMHRKICSHLDEEWIAKYRKEELVSPPGVARAGLVPHLMSNYMLDWHDMDSFKAHTRFEKIHPFIDRNGRIGRLIWLWKALQEGYTWKLSFLHQFYYQSLSHQK